MIRVHGNANTVLLLNRKTNLNMHSNANLNLAIIHLFIYVSLCSIIIRLCVYYYFLLLDFSASMQWYVNTKTSFEQLLCGFGEHNNNYGEK